MGIKKIARPMNKAKNSFVKWLKENDAEDIDVFEGEKADGWDYYRSVSGFVNNNFYMVDFMIWDGENNIYYSDEENLYSTLTIKEFMELLK